MVAPQNDGGSGLWFFPGKVLCSCGDFERRQLFSLWFRGEVVERRLAATVNLCVQVLLLREVEAPIAPLSPIKFPGGGGSLSSASPAKTSGGGGS